MRLSAIVLILQGAAAAALGISRITTAPVGSGRAMMYGVMALVGIGLVLALAVDVLIERARHVRHAREVLRRMRAVRALRAPRAPRERAAA
jgi:hypothetical protein